MTASMSDLATNGRAASWIRTLSGLSPATPRKPAITDYEVLATDASTGTALVLCHLHTGRTHQIRVHMHHKGAPLVGDPIYGKPSKQAAGLPQRLMLHAWKLSFDHPVGGRKLAFESPVPDEFSPWMEMWNR